MLCVQGLFLVKTLSPSDWISVAGVVVSLVGFAVTIYGVFRSKSAADAAKYAADNTRKSLERYDASIELRKVLESVQEIIRMNRNNMEWAVVADRYSVVRQSVVALSLFSGFDDDDKTQMVSFISHLDHIQERAETSIHTNATAPSRAKANSELRTRMMALSVINDKLQRSH